jgi:hypothetical protein
MDIRELNLDTMTKLAETIKQKEGTFSQFDGVIYELIEAGFLEADSGNFGRAIWDGKEVIECDACNEFSTDTMLHQDSGLVMCSGCFEEEEE